MATSSEPCLTPDVDTGRVRVETGFSAGTLRLLGRMGHRVVVMDAMGCTQTVQRTDKGFFGASDPRRTGGACLGL